VENSGLNAGVRYSLKEHSAESGTPDFRENPSANPVRVDLVKRLNWCRMKIASEIRPVSKIDQKRILLMTSLPSADADSPLESLYRDQARELWALFYAYCGNAERAQDAVHESFLKLQQQTEEIRDHRAWLIQVGRNWLRDQARRKVNSVIKTESLDLNPGKDHEPIKALFDHEQREQIRAALRKLKEADREVLILRYALNWSSQRIGETLVTSAAAVDMRLTRARQRLAIELEQLGFEHD